MKSTKILFAAAALSGLVAGTSARAAAPSSSSQRSQMGTNAGTRAVALDDAGKHACKGQNACKGQGGCKTGDNGCKAKNSCKGNGGCKTMTPPTTGNL